ncbi:DHA2 family efflux MFS transporter permease subunit [Pseudooceanicola sp. CBS1P-1]|uniref:DHA2 family efflux MFS transporter permease subunit n=1 Tax=Pseudooceanicola albus TaxID=2692189 RepID=A0A6L7G8B9_9RHOB|nr:MULTISPECIES: DHA2 family efflux MFS transporter permease subunit [Pseudooceanicola]MBT9385668.1 DHA2 family efflux MFS transporter permease subunit [Pseudooceanicola endophyticus]MXN18923.1 DHA2 family efflux MFS transporter permease subunit [Pseudooceanicola albus]
MSDVAQAPSGRRQWKPGEKADGSDWLTVFAGTLGALMATLDISITNSALPTIQGAIGASSTEATWISTAYLVPEIIMIPLTGWFTRMLGLRTFLLIMTVLFVVFSMMCGISDTLGSMIVGRIGQGFTGGAMIPTAMTIVSTRLPPAQRPVGMALFGFTAVMGPVLGPLLGGWLTEAVSWHYAFFINLPVGIFLTGLLFVGMKHTPARLQVLKEADWLGIIGMSVGLGCLTVVLEEGQRENWFQSETIVLLSVLTAIGIFLLLVGQVYARRPVIDLSILLQREFGSVFIMALLLGAALYGMAYMIPQFLASIADYNSLQSGIIVLISGLPTLAMMPFIPILVKTIDLRGAVIFGFCMYALSCWVDTELTANATGADFYLSQVLRGLGQGFSMLFLNQAASSSVPDEKAEDASGLFNAARNLGGSIGLAMIATLQARRSAFHGERLSEQITTNSPQVQHLLDQYSGTPQGTESVLSYLSQLIHVQALVMTYNDIFYLYALALIVVMPLALILRPLPKGQAPSATH